MKRLKIPNLGNWKIPANKYLKWILLLTALLVLLVIVAVSCKEEPAPELTLKLNIEGGITLEYGEEYIPCTCEVLLNGEKVDAQITYDPPKLDKLGSVTVIYTATYEGHSITASHTIDVVDTKAPVITLLQIPGHFTEYGQEYVEEGFIATDNYDGDITHIVTSTVSDGQVTYTVSDSSGNTTEVTRTIVYGDSVAPIITLQGEQTLTLYAGTKFVDPGFTAQDNVDGDLTSQVVVSGEFDIYQPGEYTVTYTVKDASGNEAHATRTVRVVGRKQPDTIDPDGKVIYLTFDDGPSAHTPQLLEILEKYNVKATFFVVGTARLEYLDDIVAGGHAIGVHSNTHEYGMIYSSEQAFFDDFYAIWNKIKDYTGVETTLCRFPGGSSNRVSKEFCLGIMSQLTVAVEAQGYQYFDWNVDSKDAGGAKTADEVYNNVINGVRGREYAIVLQHDIHKYSVDAVERIIQWGLANGYSFQVLNETSPKAHHKVQN